MNLTPASIALDIKMATLKKKIGVCLIGLGNFGKLIAERLDKIDGCILKYGFHPDPKEAKDWDKKRGISDLKTVFRDPEIKAFFLATPNHIRLQYAREILNHKKHLYIAKPLAHTLKEALKIKKIATLHPELKVMVGHNFRRYLAVRESKKILGKKQIGKIINITVNHSHGGIFNSGGKEWKWRVNKKLHSEGPLITVGIHLVDILHYLLGPIEEVYGTLENISGIGTAPDCNAFLLKLKNGATAFLQTNYNMPSEKFITIHGTEGTIYIEREEISLRLGRDKDRVPTLSKKIKVFTVDPIKLELEEFIDSIVSGRKIETGIREGLNALSVIDACRRSAEKGTPISLKRYKNYFR